MTPNAIVHLFKWIAKYSQFVTPPGGTTKAHASTGEVPTSLAATHWEGYPHIFVEWDMATEVTMSDAGRPAFVTYRVGWWVLDGPIKPTEYTKDERQVPALLDKTLLIATEIMARLNQAATGLRPDGTACPIPPGWAAAEFTVEPNHLLVPVVNSKADYVTGWRVETRFRFGLDTTICRATDAPDAPPCVDWCEIL